MRFGRKRTRHVDQALDRDFLCGIMAYTQQLALTPMPPFRRNAAKIQTLHQPGVLNPHPEAVTDPLFQTADFFDPQDLLQVNI
jgi:hypothetical protein